ncbi:hypothetical protein E3N88_10515 [Mikania micrantha]|uniref:Uncharacterized protein n=1 Tax=Mikania micrantha TaxID=192012 RepID=A0A5N6PCU0_9ASTR|nr:hypothetical protein E3N88_10515 [Mikania micrantha]
MNLRTRSRTAGDRDDFVPRFGTGDLDRGTWGIVSLWPPQEVEGSNIVDKCFKVKQLKNEDVIGAIFDLSQRTRVIAYRGWFLMTGATIHASSDLDDIEMPDTESVQDSNII